jgi:diaminopimelate decarboxylase
MKRAFPSPGNWGVPIRLEDIARRTRQVLNGGESPNRAFIVHDVGEMESRFSQLAACFPPSTVHAVAIKANPVVGVLRELVNVGAGLEAASIEEVALAEEAGCPPGRLVFDSPAKTTDELRNALKLGTIVNADNSVELQRISVLVNDVEAPEIGIRVNPEVGDGRIKATSVGARGSKFGVALAEASQNDFAMFRNFEFITGIHVHVGSQGCDMSQLVDGVRRGVDLALAINTALGEQRIRFIDIGGGLPTSYDGSTAISITEYATSLRHAAPELFDGNFRIITELGRSLQAQCGWVASRVEYVKEDLIVAHVGADLFMRTAYHPADWPHGFALLDPHGGLKTVGKQRWTIGGPLCFAGDIIGRGVELPDVAVGDLLIVRDAGAYTLSTWSRHCSRGIPAVIGVREENGHVDHWVLRSAEKPSDVVSFWGAGDERAPNRNP